MTSDLAPMPAAPARAPGDALKRRGANTYLGASAVAQVCALLRYTILARLLGAEQLGLAAAIILTSQFFESITDSGSDRFLIQDRDGDAPEVQKFVQMVFAGRGILLAIALATFAWPIAAFYRVPSLGPALAVLAVSPLIYGFFHLDMRRAQRNKDFRTEGIALLVSESAGLVATVTAAVLTRSYTSILYGLIVRSIAIVLVSHLKAERPYAIAFSAKYAPRLARFAAPLMLNGLLIFFGSQGDRIVIGDRLGLAALGHYSAVLLLVFYPSAVISRYVSAIHLPNIATAAHESGARATVAMDRLAGQTLLLGMLLVAGFTVVGPTAVVVLYGSKFQQPVLDVCLIGFLQAIRLIRIWPNTAAIGIGRSGIVLANNISRLVGLGLGLWAGVRGFGIPGVVGGLIVGELAALITALLLLNRATGSRPYHDMDRFAFLVLEGAGLVGIIFGLQDHSVPLVALSSAAVLIVAGWTTWREAATVAEAVRVARRSMSRIAAMWAPALSKGEP
jgi:O-antigen/teichoic acid export membrane protein